MIQKKNKRFSQCEPIWREKREYPWQPGRNVVPSQSFAAIRAGLLPALVLNDDGDPVYTIIDVHTPDGMKLYDAQHDRTLQPEISGKIEKKRSKSVGLKKMTKKAMKRSMVSDAGGGSDVPA